MFITETIKQSDTRACQFDKYENKWIEGLILCKTWKIVRIEYFPKYSNIRKGRFILVMKDEGTSKENLKLVLLFKDIEII